GLVALAVAEEAPDTLRARVADAAVAQVAVEARLVDRGERTETHGDRGELPELRHEPRVRVRRQALAPLHLTAEVIELILGEPAFEEGASVDARRRVTLEIDLVPAARIVLPAEEPVEADLVERR